MPRLVAIVPAAGIGARAAGASVAPEPKQYRNLAGQTMLRWTVQALLRDTRISRVVVAVSMQDARVHGALAGLPRTSWLPCGGPTRYDTVMNALSTAGVDAGDWVLVHDAARPGLPPGALSALIDACLQDPVGGLLALPVADTIKVSAPGATEDGAPPRVARTLSREHLWQAQTPQMFRAGMLADAFEFAARNGMTPTDEASAIEALGHQPLLVRGAMANLKVTWPEDFEWMEKWLG
nr:2-C-methyl-D-erythritol 4-phosphate cytidylyltransferase [Pseudomonas sp.]